MTILDPNSIAFVNRLASNAQGRAPLTSVAIAKAISSVLPLPTSPVEVIDSYYRTVCSINVTQLISKINELVLVDATAIGTYVNRFYNVRYYAAHPPALLCCLNPNTVVQDFFSLQMGIDEGTLEIIKSNPVKLTQYHNSAKDLVKELLAKMNEAPSVCMNGDMPCI
jgi:hypothetical protein